AESAPGVLSASLALGFPYADVPELGVTCVGVADGDERLAREAAARIALAAWAARAGLQGEALDADGALELATDGRRGPVPLLDAGENIGGGSPGDSTTILHAARRRGIAGYLETIRDPEAVSRCAAAGVGGDVSLEVGGRVATHDPPCPVSGRVRAL